MLVRSFLLGLTTVFILASCAIKETSMPIVDLQAEHWQLWSGQALWQPNKDRPRFAGDIIIAINDSGEVFVEMSKAAVVLFRAQTFQQQWELLHIEKGRPFSGNGKPPKQFIWFYLPDYLVNDKPLPGKHWQAEQLAPDIFQFNNTKSGENVRLVLDQPLS